MIKIKFYSSKIDKATQKYSALQKKLLYYLMALYFTSEICFDPYIDCIHG
jgi:hypothetical protein